MPASRMRRDLRLSVADGVACTIMVACGELSLPLLAIAAGLGAFGAAAVATTPVLVGAVVQSLVPLVMGRVTSARRWVIGCIVVQASSFLPIAVWAARGQVTLAELLVAMSVYWSAGMASLAAWNVWMAALVPPRVRPSFFAFRSRLTLCSIIVGLVSSGGVLFIGERQAAKMTAFAVLFGIAAIARLVSAACMAACSEPACAGGPLLAGTMREIVRELVAIVRGMALRPSGAIVAYLVCFVFGAQIAAPYLSPYLLQERHLGDATLVFLMAVGFSARLVVLPAMGRLAAQKGAVYLLQRATLALACVTLLWLVSGRVAYVVPVQCVAGASLAGHELAVTLLLFGAVADRERIAVVTLHTLGSTMATVAGAACGATILSRCGSDGPAYAALFIASAAFQFAALLIAHRVRAGTSRNTPCPVGDHVSR